MFRTPRALQVGATLIERVVIGCRYLREDGWNAEAMAITYWNGIREQRWRQ